MSSPWSAQDTKTDLAGADKFLIIDSAPAAGTTINKQVSFTDLVNSITKVRFFREAIDAVLEIQEGSETAAFADIVTIGTQSRKVEGFRMKGSLNSELNFKLASPPGIVNNTLSSIRVTFITLTANASKIVRLDVATSHIANSEAVDGSAFNIETPIDISVATAVNSTTVVDFPLIQGGFIVAGDFIVGLLERAGSAVIDDAGDILVTKIQLITTVAI